jgi:two-component system cell cycle sensor histidine kinase/response regulator CckA
VPVEMSSRRMPNGDYQSILRDASERRRAERERRLLEARLHQARRMEAIGRLAGGVAHDYNNLLAAITGNLTLAQRDLPSGGRTHRWLKEADAAAWRAADITRQLLSFANQRDVEWETLDLRDLVEELRPRLAGLISEPVSLDIRLADGPCLVCVDRGQIERALVNLTVNGRDAMPNGGTLTCEVGRAAGEEVRRAHPTARPGPYVVLSVTDDGSGMSDDVRSRLFEPFFTTKLAGSTAGLGLALVYAVAEQNQGWIDVASVPGHGTTFRLHLPRAAAAGPSPPPQSPSVS